MMGFLTVAGAALVCAGVFGLGAVFSASGSAMTDHANAEARRVLEEAEDLDGPELRNAVRRALQYLRGRL